MNLKLSATRAPGAAVRAVLLALAKQARRDLVRAESAREAAVHDLRTGMKKYRSLLRLAHESLAEAARVAVIERVKALKDGAAGSRDAAVIAKTMARVLGREAAWRSEAKFPPAEECRWDAAAMMRAAWELESLTRALRLESLGRGALKRAWKRSLRKSRRVGRTARRSAAAADFHQWRKRLKDLWYQGEALSNRVPKAAKVGCRAGKLSDVLGDEHDLTLVLDTVKDLPPPILEKLEHARSKLRRRAFRMADDI